MSMENILEIIDKSERKIRLTKERWTHITLPTSLHPYMTNYLEEIKQALANPDLIIKHQFNEQKADYYLYLKREKLYLLVGVNYLNGEGFITTAFLVRNVKKP